MGVKSSWVRGFFSFQDSKNVGTFLDHREGDGKDALSGVRESQIREAEGRFTEDGWGGEEEGDFPGARGKGGRGEGRRCFFSYQ